MKKAIRVFIQRNFQRLRIYIFKALSNNSNIIGYPTTAQPTIFVGKGRIKFGSNVQIGYFPSPLFFDGVSHIEARNENSEIVFGNDIFINNGFKIICDKTKISIGDNTLIGYSVNIFDSDFHEISPEKRNSGNHYCKEVLIGKNVFIGSNVAILKGVSIGENSIVAYGSIVTRSFPANVIIGGNPAKIISTINE
jgi:acetyltransferase-like isoleucine patch superfamily enzyme